MKSFHRKVWHFLAHRVRLFWYTTIICVSFFHSEGDTSKPWFLNTPTVSSGDENSRPRIFLLMCGNKESVPLRIDRLTMLTRNSHHMTSFAEETGHHLLRRDISTNNFCWFWLGFKDPHGGVLFCFGLIRIGRRFVTCGDLINVIWRTAILFFQNFSTSIDKNLFLSDCEIQR